MNGDGELIDKIVAGVLERLGTPSIAAREEPGPKPSTSASTSVHFSENVVTAETLLQRVNGHGSITVGPKTVLTPAAQDFLREHAVSWTRTLAGSTGANSVRWLAVVMRTTPTVSAALKDLGDACRAELVGDIAEAIRLAVGAVCRADAVGAIVYCIEPHRAACLANRNARIRAAAVDTAAGVERIVQEIGVNVLAVDPTERSYIELRNIVRAFTCGVPQPPQPWLELV
jgi:hypothetical protein